MNIGVRTRPGINGEPVIVGAYCPRCQQESLPGRGGRCGWCDTKIISTPLEGAGHIETTSAHAGPHSVVPPAPSSGAEPAVDPRPAAAASLAEPLPESGHPAGSSPLETVPA